MRKDLVPFGNNLPFRRPFEDFFRLLDDTVNLNRAAVDIYEEGDNVVVKADLPGFKKDEIKLDVEDDTLLLQAEKQKDEEEDKREYYRRERAEARFREAITLPVQVDKEQASARMEDGVLEVRLPKAERSKNAKRIEIR